MRAASGQTRRTALFLALGSVAVLVAAALSIVLGSARIPFATVWDALFRFDAANLQHQIIHDLRVPRTLGDALVGAALAVAGAIMQGMTRNPLADSGILGINAGAAFALSLCLALLPGVQYGTVVLCAFAGAALSTLIVYGLTGLNHGKQSPARLALAGTAVGTLLSAVSQAVALHHKVGQEVTFWMAGGVGGIRMHQIARVAPFVLAALAAALALSFSLSLLGLGEEAARGLGLHIRRTKALCMLVVLILAGSAVSLAGPVSFVGLIVPHLTRAAVGQDYRKIIPCSMVLGSFSMLAADVLSRLLNPPHETPVGLVFAVVGVPFFLHISRRGRREIGV